MRCGAGVCGKKADQEQIIADAVQASAALLERAGLRDLIADWMEPALH